MVFPMTEIILARHGETEWNVGVRYRGRIDVNLNELGVTQGKLLGVHLSRLKIAAIYSSPLNRALDTANILARYQHVDVQVTDGLVDFDYGEWQGLSDLAVRKLYPALHREWLASPHLVTMPGGESLADVRERAVGVVKDVVWWHSGSVALVSHRVVNKVLICSLLGLDNSRFWDIRMDVGAITTFEYVKGRFILTKHNETSYLGATRNPLSDF